MSRAERIEIHLDSQQLLVIARDGSVTRYSVSSAKNGPGERMDSERTPRGKHQVSEKFGAQCALNTVFVGRRPTGEIYAAGLAQMHPGRDWILTRILWLSGLEAGRNAGGQCDTKARYIYIHGSPDSVPMGAPGSRGCIRMRNCDVVDVFRRVDVGTPVDIAP
jgi:L,D-transpeptidase YbiS